jgi:uncharacterized pyridoxal phosphate-containing UPF0001 family protein
MNTSGEESKTGYENRDALLRDLDEILLLPSLAVTGLMTIGPLAADEKEMRRSFASLRTLFEEILAGRALPQFRVLSMGMSQDYPIAVTEGATLVRIGTALFGPRRQV